MPWYPDLPHDEAGGHGGLRTLTQIVVIHATANTASDEAEAHYAEHRPDQVSAHFYNDDDSIIQGLDTDVVAYGCYSIGNSRSVQFELVGLDWDDPPGPGAVSIATMRRVAPIVARVCHEYSIPIRKIGPDELRAGVRGICGHADVTRAWGQGDHLDPGPAFPWDLFINYVRGDDMEQTEKVTGFGSRGNSVGDVLADVSNFRDELYLTPAQHSKNPPPAGSRFDMLMQAAQRVLSWPAPGTVTLSDTQVAAIVSQVATAVISNHDALQPGDAPVIEAAVGHVLDRVLRAAESAAG